MTRFPWIMMEERVDANGLAERLVAINLKAQVLAAATKGMCGRMLEGATTSVMQKIKKLVDGGIHARSSMSHWHTSNLGGRM